MKKTDAISMLGGDVASAAKALGISYQAVTKWPDVLPQRISDRVLGAYARTNKPEFFNPAAICVQTKAAA